MAIDYVESSDTPLTDLPVDGKRQCPDCGKVVTVTSKGALRKHRCLGDAPRTRGGRKNSKPRERVLHDAMSVPVAALSLLGNTLDSPALIADAVVLRDASPQIALALAEVAERNESLARVVDSLVQSSPYAALFTAMLPVAIAVAGNHSDALAVRMGLPTAGQRVERLQAEVQAQTAEAAKSAMAPQPA